MNAVAHQAPLSMRFPSKSTGVGCHFLLQGIFPTQGSNLPLLHWQADSLLLSHQGSPRKDIYLPKVTQLTGDRAGVLPTVACGRWSDLWRCSSSGMLRPLPWGSSEEQASSDSAMVWAMRPPVRFYHYLGSQVLVSSELLFSEIQGREGQLYKRGADFLVQVLQKHFHQIVSGSAKGCSGAWRQCAPAENITTTKKTQATLPEVPLPCGGRRRAR